LTLPSFSDVCLDYLTFGFCSNSGCQKVHHLLGVLCPLGIEHGSEDPRCPFVHGSVEKQREVWDNVFHCHLPEPFDNDVGLFLMLSDLEFSRQCTEKQKKSAFWQPIVCTDKRPELPERDKDMKASDLDNGPPEDYEEVDLEYWPENDIERFCVRKSLWGPMDEYKTGCLLLDLFRARFHEGVICEMMRNYHGRVFAELTDKEKKRQEMRLRDMYHNRGIFTSWGTIFDEEDEGECFYPSLMMRSPAFASFCDTMENVLFLYRSTVREAVTMLNKFLDSTPSGMPRKLYVFAPNLSPADRQFSFAILHDVLDWAEGKEGKGLVSSHVVVLNSAVHKPGRELTSIKEPSFMILEFMK